jgi:hypothetical protein
MGHEILCHSVSLVENIFCLLFVLGTLEWFLICNFRNNVPQNIKGFMYKQSKNSLHFWHVFGVHLFLMTGIRIAVYN